MINISIFDFNTAVISRRRQGTPDDPYIDIQESQQIINNKAILSEIPDTFTKVQVSGQNITWIETTGVPSENQYQVDYNEALVLFHESKNGLTLSFSYKGTGAHYLNIKRIFTQVSDSDEILQTLDQVVDNANLYLSISDQLINKGVYNPETIYYKRNIVTYNNNSAYMYINELPNSNKLLTDTVYWQQIINVEDIINLLTSTNNTVNNEEIIRQNQESARVIAENLRITSGALIKSGGTMTGNLDMGENLIQLGGFTIRHNTNLNSLDIEF